MLSSNALSEDESLKVMKYFENSDSLHVNAKKDPIMESSHFGNNAATNLTINADFKDGAKVCLEKDSFVIEYLVKGTNLETKS